MEVAIDTSGRSLGVYDGDTRRQTTHYVFEAAEVAWVMRVDNRWSLKGSIGNEHLKRTS